VTAQSGRNFGIPIFNPLPGNAIIVDVPCATSSSASSKTLATV